MYRRTFTGAWIETLSKQYATHSETVAPSQVRGLKPGGTRAGHISEQSHPHGNVAVNIQCQPYWMGISFSGFAGGGMPIEQIFLVVNKER